MATPHFVAICGWPGAGKSEVQKLLAEHGYQPVDDGACVRDFAVRQLGLTLNQVSTPDGKREVIDIAGREWVSRKVLGELARVLEGLFGEYAMPWIATRSLGPGMYSFGSVRMRQAAFYKRLGGLVIGVRRAGVEPTGNVWDEFDESLVDIWIENNGSLDMLRLAVTTVMEDLSGLSIAA